MGVVAAVVAGAAAVGGAVISANSASKSAKSAAAKNRQQFDESRGSTGHAFLPLYTGNAEQQTFNDLYSIYQSGENAAQRELAGKQILQAMQPAVQGGNQYLLDAYSGANLATSRGYYQPLWDARSQQAQAQADAIQQAYAQSRQADLAANMRQGYFGGSSVQSREAQRNTLAALQQAAVAKGGAQVQNASENTQLGISDLVNRQQLLNAPLSRTQELINYRNLPQEASYTGYDQLARRLGLFNIGTGKTPDVAPEIGKGQIYGSALSSLGQMGLNAYMAQQSKPTYINITPSSGGAYNFGTGGYTGGAGAGSTGGYMVIPSSGSTINFGGVPTE